MSGYPSLSTFLPSILPVFLSLKADLPVLFKTSIWHPPDAAFKSYHITPRQKDVIECLSLDLLSLTMMGGWKLAFVGQHGFTAPC